MAVALPPPMHGYAEMCRAVVAAAGDGALTVSVIDLSPKRPHGAPGYRTARVKAFVAGLLQLTAWILCGEVRRLYLAVSGGAGQWFDLMLAALARLAGADIVVHHHSFAYIDRRSPAMARIVRAAGPRALHVLLCPAMAMRFRAAYPDGGETLAVSNLAFLEPQEAAPKADRLRRIGLLSNLSMAKGVGGFLAILEGLRARGIDIEGVLAGPIADIETAQAIHAAVSAGLVRHLGPVSGAGKAAFFADIDAFVFPTRYRNEAEPLVVLEAMQHGLPVVASDRGCIGAAIGGAGLLLDRDGGDVTRAVEQLAEWARSPAVYLQARAASLARAAAATRQAAAARQALLARLHRD